MNKISVIICTHNPRRGNFLRVLEALRLQTLEQTLWELIVVDNASTERLSSEYDLSWHPQARHVAEPSLGLTPARIRGILESNGELLVFVDDDNLLFPDYLETALLIKKQFPQMAVYGGQILPEFETPPDDWIKPYLRRLALKEFSNDQWSNNPMRLGGYPCGAGMCLTKELGLKYSEHLQTDKIRSLLDRRGDSLSSAGDDDIAFTAGDLGLGVGVFKVLQLTHIIPAARLKKEYILRLVREMTISGQIVRHLHGQHLSQPRKIEYLQFLVGILKKRGIHRKIAIAQFQAKISAHKILNAMRMTS